MRRLRIGMAIGVDSIEATWRAQAETIDWITAFQCDDGRPPSIEIIRRAFAELREQLPSDARITLGVAILPPLARLRRVELPRMTDEERRLAITRAADRYFIGLPAPVCAVERTTGDGSGVPFVAAAVSAALIDDVQEAAHDLGWSIERFVPAHSAWLASVCGSHWKLRGCDCELVIPEHREVTVLTIRAGKITIARRLRPREISNTPPSPDVRSITLGGTNRSPAMIAATAVVSTRALEFVSELVRHARREARLRATRLLSGVAVACVCAAAVVHRRGLSQQLDTIARQRNAIHSRVARALSACDTLATLSGSINSIAGLERTAPRWSAVLARIAIALPRDASVITLRADGDSVTIEGQASNAAAVFGAMRSAPGVTGIRPATPIRQELVAGQHAIEHWTLALRVDHNIVVRSGR